MPPPGTPLPIEPVAVKVTRRAGRSAWPLVVWAVGTSAVLAWWAVGWVTIWRLGRKAEQIFDQRWLEAAREAADRLGVAMVFTGMRHFLH